MYNFIHRSARTEQKNSSKSFVASHIKNRFIPSGMMSRIRKENKLMQNNSFSFSSLVNALTVQDLATGKVYSREDQTTPLVNEDGVEVNLDNPDLFRVVVPGPEPVPNFLVQGGKLVPPAEQGQIFAEKILSNIHGGTVFEARPLSDKAAEAGLHDIFLFRPNDGDEGSFKKLFSEVPSPEIVDCRDDEHLLFVINAIEETTVKDENGEEQQKLAFKRASVNLLNNGFIEATYEASAPVREVRCLEAPNGAKQVVIIEDSFVEYDDEHNLAELKPLDGLRLVRLNGEMDEIGEQELRHVKTIDSMSLDLKGDLLLVAGNLLYFSNDGYRPRFVVDPAVAETAGYDHIAALTFGERGTETYVLFNENRETVKLIDRRTSDRGHIVTVEKGSKA